MSLKNNKLFMYFLAFTAVFCLLQIVLYQNAHNNYIKSAQQETKTAVSDRLGAFVMNAKPSNAGMLIDEQSLKTKPMLVNQNTSYRTRVDIHKAVQQAVTGSLENLPTWLQDYIIWHNQVRSTLAAENYSSHRFLIMTCLACDDRCGGTADRLVPIPLMLFVAHQTKRLLLIYWERPAPLEDFLSPTLLDWRLPSFLKSKIHCHNDTSVLGTVDLIVEHAQSEERIVSTRCQSANYGAQYYNEQQMLRNTSDTLFDLIFRDVWRSMFQPSPMIRTLVEDALEKLHLFPNEYAAAHLRGLYGQHNRSQRVLDAWTRSAVNCASQIRPGGPIYFASDSAYATQTAQEYGEFRGGNGIVVVTRPTNTNTNPQQPLHLDKGASSNASSYYDTFVDLYLLSMSQCLVYSKGGFGKWGSLLSFNYSCGYRFLSSSQSKRCKWARGYNK
jgi:hypothetical protein